MLRLLHIGSKSRSMALGLGLLLSLSSTSLRGEEGSTRQAGKPASHGNSATNSTPRFSEGPLFQYRLGEESEMWSLSPFFSHSINHGADSEEWDVLYPFFTIDRTGLEYRYQFIQLLSWSGGGAQDDKGTRRFTLFPFYFQQRSEDPSKNYTALFPFYGTMRGHLFRDEVKVIMAPFFLRSKKQDFTTDNYLMPFFHLRYGPQVKGWQFWPLYGTEHRSVSTRTNGFGEAELIPGHDKTMALWPFFFSQHLGVGSDNPDRRLVALPFYNMQRSRLRDSTSWVWPFGYTLTEDREKKYREQAILYPFIVWADGEGKQAYRLWPLASVTKVPGTTREVYLWPLYRHDHAKAEPLDRERTRILYFIYSDLKEKNTVTGTELRRTELWPLFAARKEPDGRKTFRMPALVESALAGNKSVERNWTPLWSVWRTEEDPAKKTSRQSALWHFADFEQTPESKKGSLFFGLLKYQTASGNTRWRFAGWPSESGTDENSKPTRP